MKIFRHLPNFLTCMNILSGGLAVVFALESANYLVLAGVMIFVASVFDFLDGMTARLLKAYSNIGKDLDSLADMVSFGMAPTAIVYQLLKTTLFDEGYHFCFCKLDIISGLILLMSFMLVIFSGLRLAKFNNDTRQTESFMGLAVPANAIVWASFPIVLHYNAENQFLKDLILNAYFLVPLIVVCSYLLVSEIPMFSLKLKSFAFAKNQIRYIFLIIIAILFLSLHSVAVLFVIPLYILLAITNNFTFKN